MPFLWSMSVDELMADPLLGTRQEVHWEQRDPRSTSELARERITAYFAECPTYNTPSVFVRYQVAPDSIGLLDKLFGRNPIIEDWVFKGDNPGEIIIASFGRKKKRSSTLRLDNYPPPVQCISMTFMFGTHYNKNCVFDWSGGSTRIGVYLREHEQ